MSVNSFLTKALAGFCEALLPLREALASPEALAGFLRKFGWELSAADIGHVSSSVGDLSALASDPSTQGLETLTADVAAAVSAIRRITQSGAPAAFANSFPRDLLDYLAYIGLAQHSPGAFALLHFVGVLGERDTPADAAAGRAPYVARTVHWERLSQLAEQPFATVAQNYGWGAQFDGVALLRSLGMLVRAFGGRASLQAADARLLEQYHAPGSPGAVGTPNLILALCRGDRIATRRSITPPSTSRFTRRRQVAAEV